MKKLTLDEWRTSYTRIESERELLARYRGTEEILKLLDNILEEMGNVQIRRNEE